MAELKSLIVNGVTRLNNTGYAQQWYAAGVHHTAVDSDSYVVLAGGGYKAISDFILKPAAAGSVAVPIYWTGSAFATVQATFGSSSYGEHNANNIVSNGMWYYTSNGPATSIGASTTDGALYSQAYNSSWVGQIAQDYRNGALFVRGKNNGTWQAWRTILDSSNWSGIVDGRYLPLAGGSMTGTIDRTYSASNQTPFIHIDGKDYDNYIWQISSGTSTNQYYGFGLKYIGTGSGVENRLRLYADNQNGTDIIAFSVNQSGQVGIGKDSSTTYALDVSGNTNISGYILSPKHWTANYEITESTGNRLCFGNHGQTTAKGINAGDLLISNTWADYTKVPTNGIYSKGVIKSGVAQGTAPFTVDSSTLVTNFNADLLDGKHASEFALAHDHPYMNRWNASGNYYTKFLTFTRNAEKGWLRFYVYMRDNSSTTYGGEYMAQWGYDATNTNKAIEIKCIYSVGIDSSTSVYAVRQSGTQFDLVFSAKTSGAHKIGFGLYGHSNSCTIDNYTVVTYEQNAGPTAAYTSTGNYISLPSHTHSWSPDITNVIQGGNEFNVTDSGYSYETLWFNYYPRNQRSDNSTELKTYYFGNLKKGYASVVATKFITSGGTSSQFVKGDGSLDSNTYSTSGHNHDGRYLKKDVNETTTGTLKFINNGSVSIRMNVNTSNAKGLGWLNTSDTTIAQIIYHNTAQNLILNPIGSANIWDDSVGKYSLFVGNNKLTYNTYPILRSDNWGTYITSKYVTRLYSFSYHNTPIKLGTCTSGQSGHFLKLSVYTGSGYNAAGSGWRIVDVYVRASNGSASGTTGMVGRFFEAYTESHYNGLPNTFYIKELSKTQYEIWIGSYSYSGKSFYSVENADGITWQDESSSGTLPTDASTFEMPNRQIAYSNNIPTVTNYYWADQSVSSSIKRLTTPAVKYVYFRSIGDSSMAGYCGRGSEANNQIRLQAYTNNSLVLGANSGTAITIDTSNNVNVSGSIILKGSTSNVMTYDGNVHPCLRFDNSDSTQNVSFIFTDYDSYRGPAGIKMVGNQGNEWLEAPKFIKTGSSDSYVLLGGGGHKLVSDFAITDFSNYHNGTTHQLSITVAGTTKRTTPEFLAPYSELTYGNSGLQYFNINGTYGTTADSNVTPQAGWHHILRMNHANSGGYFADIAVPLNNLNGIYWRQVRNGTNYGWYKVLDTNNVSPSIGVSGNTIRITVGGVNSSYVTVPYAWTGYVTTPNNLSSYWYIGWTATITDKKQDDLDMTFLISSSYNSLYGMIHVRIRQEGNNGSGAYNFGFYVNLLYGNIPLDRVRLAVNNSTGKCDLWFNVAARWGVFNITVVKKCWRTSNDVASIGTLNSVSFTTVQTVPSLGSTCKQMEPINQYTNAIYASDNIYVNKTGISAFTKVEVRNTSGGADIGYDAIGSNKRLWFGMGSGNNNRGIYGYYRTVSNNTESFTSGKWYILFADDSPTATTGNKTVLQYGGSLTLQNNNLTLTGNYYANSDIRLKNIISTENLTAEQFISFPVIKYKWKDGRDNKLHLGSTAQSVENIFPELVSESDDGTKNLDYTTLGAIGVLSLAREIVELKKQIKELQKKLNG